MQSLLSRVFLIDCFANKPCNADPHTFVPCTESADSPYECLGGSVQYGSQKHETTTDPSTAEATKRKPQVDKRNMSDSDSTSRPASAKQMQMMLLDHEEDAYVLEQLLLTCRANLAQVVAAEAASHFQEGELAMRILEASASPTFATKGMDVKFEVKWENQLVSTKCKPIKVWDVGVKHGAVHIMWNEVCKFRIPGRPVDLGLATVSVVREDGTELASATLNLDALSHQQMVQRWYVLNNGWKACLALQYVRSPADLLRSHVELFETKLAAVRERLAGLRREIKTMRLETGDSYAEHVV
mmetsp:Transcript_18984/g.42502  ORF Transcript_18984/g.42502 Transcript_18984/m.42502 type:complete len:299 (+) Transcript_18984:113-1009(+)